MLVIYVAALASELASPTQTRGPVTLERLAGVAAFTLTFGPVFEELLFRGHLFRRVDDVVGGKAFSLGLCQASFASVLSGLLFGLWHLPTPVAVLYFHDPLVSIYAGLAGFVAAASTMGVLLGEVRRRTGSILPGVLLHLRELHLCPHYGQEHAVARGLERLRYFT